MSLATIILFFVITWGLGFTATALVKIKPKNSLEKNLMAIGIGLGVFPILSILLNLLRIPLDWKIFLLLSIIYPLIYLAIKLKNKELNFKPNLKLKKSTITILIVLFIFFATLFMYHKGSFAYPYLENADPWSHATGAKYISIEKTAFDPPREDLSVKGNPLSYMDPYPPSYDILMGVLHQTNDSINWTLKFFNSLILSLGIIFFYFFAKDFIGSRNKALFATFILAAIPSYMSHFIWAHSLIPALFFVSIYCLEKVEKDKGWMLPAVLVIASIPVTQPTQPIKLAVLFLIYLGIKSLMQKKFLSRTFYSLAAGGLLSFLWWGNMLFKYGGLKGITHSFGLGMKKAAESVSTSQTGLLSFIISLFPPDSGTATRAYSFNDFLIAKHTGMINNPIGWGIFITLLLAVFLIYIIFKYKRLLDASNYWLPITILWFLFTFLGVNSMTFNLPIGFFGFRFWMLLAIPVALLAAEGAWALKDFLRKFGIPAFLIFLVLVGGIYFTSASQKYSINTSLWPTYGYFGGGQPQAAIEYAEWFSTLPKNTPIFTYSDRNHVIAGFDMFSCSWCDEVIQITKGSCILNKTTEELHSFLKKYNYEYMIVSSSDFKYIGRICGENMTMQELPKKVEGFVSSELFDIAYQVENLFIAFKIK